MNHAGLLTLAVHLSKVAFIVHMIGYPIGAAAFASPRTCSTFTGLSRAPTISSDPFDQSADVPGCSTFMDSRFHSSSRQVTNVMASKHEAETDDGAETSIATAEMDPQVMSAGYSKDIDLVTALQIAVGMAMEGVPKSAKSINLAVVSVSSLYDGNASPSAVVPAVLTAVRSFGVDLDNLIGSTNGGYITSQINADAPASTTDQKIIFGDDVDKEVDGNEDQKMPQACKPLEQEGITGVSVVLCVFPDVELKTFHVSSSDIPDELKTISPDEWKSIIGLEDFKIPENDSPSVFLLPSPAFQSELKELLGGLSRSLSQKGDGNGVPIFGAIASTVSSLSRARLFRHDARDPGCINTLADGCVGVAMSGDIKIETMMAQGAKPVGGVYRVVKGAGSTIQSIALDEAATELVVSEEEEEEEEEIEDPALDDKKAKLAAAYAKARIPKPPLAEANFIMRTLSDDDQAFMSKFLLVGVEAKRGMGMWNIASELDCLVSGKGHRFEVHQVASAGTKDGSITMSLGAVNVEPGMRLRFFVRDNKYSEREVEALWKGYKKRVLTDPKPKPTPTGCFMFPTLDRGSKFYVGKAGFESAYVSQYLRSIPCISGFFSNGIISRLQMDDRQGNTDSVRMYGSGTGYMLLSSKSGRPIFSAAEEAKRDAAKEILEAEEESALSPASLSNTGKKAQRDERGELILKRREIHSGRALTVSTVEWSVAEKTASPSSALEGFMWDKETEVDRFRERVPLSNLVSQCRLSSVDPTKPKPRDWVGPVRNAATATGKFVIIPECKRAEPLSGSLRKRYDLSKLAREFALSGAPSISVNCDAVLFGGSLEDITKVREVLSTMEKDDISAALPILASDLLLYPYQLYKISLAGADAVNLIVGALAPKDLTYLTKIASSLKLQSLVTVTSPAQIQTLDILPVGGVDGMIVSNRQLEDFSFDMTGQQALDILHSDEFKKFREKHGDDFPVLCEGRVGLIERKDKSGSASVTSYLEELKEAGAIGAVVGGGLVEAGDNLLLDTLAEATS